MDFSLAIPGLLPFWSKDAPGYVASAFVLATFCMNAMRPLRMVAICSNFAFIYYAAVADLYPVLILHSILLPVNVTRLTQIEFARISGNRLLAQTTSPVVDMARPIFIASQAMTADPSTALSLAEREQQRVACMLPSHLVETGEAQPAPGTSGEAGRAAVMLLDEIDRFLAGVATGGSLSAAQSTQLIALRSRDEVLRAVHETLAELVRLLDATALPVPLVVTLREGLGAILLFAEDAARSLGSDEIVLLKRVTSDRSDLVEQLRSRAMADGSTDHRAIYNVTALYERCVWLLQRYAGLLEVAGANT